MVGWDHGSPSDAMDEGPPVAGLEIVVGVAKPVRLVDARVMCRRPVLAVIDLQPVRPGTAFARTQGIAPPRRDLLSDGGRPSEVRDVHNVDTFDDHELQNRVAEQVACG